MEARLEIGNIPKLPGCYIFRNSREEIIYIGKSKSLHNRVRQYFYVVNDTSYRYNKYTDLAKEIHTIETIVTDTETDALILECQLIKRHKPKYNSQLKRTRAYPFIKINVKNKYPSLTITESSGEAGMEFFGSFYSKDDAFSAIELINSIWQTPLCLKESWENVRPCLNYHIGKCCAPCGKMVESETYRQKAVEVVKCLKGNFKPTLNRLNKEMKEAAGSLEFEKAAKLRDSIDGLLRLQSKQKRIYTDLDNKDVYLFLRAYNERRYSIFFIKNGIMLNRIAFTDLAEPDYECLEAFIQENAGGKITVSDGSFLTRCILDIGASKLFVPAYKRANVVQLAKKLKNSYKEFIGG